MLEPTIDARLPTGRIAVTEGTSDAAGVRFKLPDLDIMQPVQVTLLTPDADDNLRHPHILPLLDSRETHGLLYYVMRYVKGESLRETLDCADAAGTGASRHPPLRWPKAALPRPEDNGLPRGEPCEASCGADPLIGSPPASSPRR